MKSRMVLWGEENENKALIALELIADENKVNIYTFNQEIATEEFYTSMMEKWRNNQELAFPEGHKVISSPLSITDDLLPEEIKVDRTDLIARAKTEWHFSVLSSKLYQMYRGELDEYKERLNNLINFDQSLWDELKEFWGKVQNHATDRNLFRDHVKDLREQTNKIFDDLKEKKSILNEEFKKTSQDVSKSFHSTMEDVEERINKGLGLKPIFDELKSIQNKFKNAKMTHGDKRKVWDRLDKAFKAVKEKRFGDSGPNQASATGRLEKRYNGLMSAIGKMESSIKRDKSDIDFQNKRIKDTDGQLELQIRQAKLIMIEQRISSKQEKYDDMIKTKDQLEKKIESEKKREEAKKRKDEERKEIAKAKKEIKSKIAGEIEKTTEELKADEDKLRSAAAALNQNKPKKRPKKAPEVAPVKEEESLLSAIGTTMGDAIEDMVDTVKAVAEVVGDKVGDAMEDAKEEFTEKKGELSAKLKEQKAKASEKIKEVKEDIKEEVGEIKEELKEKKDKAAKKVAEVKAEIKEEVDEVKKDVKEKQESKGGSMIAALGSVVGEAFDNVVDKALDVAEVVGDKVEDIVDDVKEEMAEKKKDLKEEVAEIKEALKEKKAKATEKVAEVKADIKEEVAEAKEEVKEKQESKGGSMIAALGGMMGDALDNVVDKALDIAEVVGDKVEDIVDDVKEEIAEKSDGLKAKGDGEEE